MPNQYKNKVVYFGDTLIDLSGDTLDASKVLSGYTGHDATGAPFNGSIATKTSSDMTASGATVTAPAGYYASAASKAVASGTAGTPTATKGTVSNHSVSVTPSVTNTTGYITGGTKTGTAVSVSASELVGGTYTVDSSGTKDVTNYASASVPAGTAGTPSASKGTVSNHSVSVTPSVTNTTGWITGSTKTGTAVSVSASELVSGTYSVTSSGTKDVTNYASASVPAGTAGTPTATKGTVSNHSVTVTPSVTNQAGFITGSTISGTGVSVSASELVSGSQTITENGTVNVANLAEVVVNVAGSGGTSEWAVIVSENLHNTSDDVADTYINGSTETAYNGWASSDYIPVKPGKLYLIRSLTSNTDVAGNVYNAFYKQNKSVSVGSFYIPQTRPVTNQTSYSIIKAPSDAYYLRMSQATAKMSITAVYELSNTIFWDYALELGGINSSGDEFGAGDGTYMRTTDYLSTDVAQYMDFVSKGDATGKALFVCYYNANKEFVTRVQTTTGYQIDTSYPYIRLSFYMSSGNDESAYRSWIVWNPPVGSKTITENGIYNAGDDGYYAYSSVTVNVSGGGGSGVQVETGVEGARTSTSSISFTGLKGQPNAFYAMVDDSVTASATATVMAFVYDGQTLHAQTLANQIAYDDSSLSYTYNNGTLTITSNGATIAGGVFYLSYAYGGTSGNIDTKDVQVGSGATSITFTGLDDEPIAWACIFKSNFSTSSGYQRVVYVDYENGDIYGTEMDSGTHNASHWTASYSNGSLTITSNGTNQGGYFHQPGYYQLTYVTGGDSGGGGSANYQTKTVSPTTSQQVITADTGYDALSQVTVNAMPTMTLPSSASGTSSGTSKATITPTSSAQYLNIPTGYNGTAQYYTIAAASGGGANIATATMTNSSNQNTSISFTIPSGRTIKACFCRLTSQIARNSSSRYYYVFDIRWDGTSTAGNQFYMYNGTLTNVTSGYSYAQSGTTVTLASTGSRSAAPGSFYNGGYELVYIY